MATDELQPQQEEQRECIVCGRSLPLSVYCRSKNGARCKTCPDCCRESRQRMKAERLARAKQPVPVPKMFEGKTPREIMDIMQAGKIYLESLGGYEITLRGIHKKTVITQLKF